MLIQTLYFAISFKSALKFSFNISASVGLSVPLIFKTASVFLSFSSSCLSDLARFLVKSLSVTAMACSSLTLLLAAGI